MAAGRCEWGNEHKRSIRRRVDDAPAAEPAPGEPAIVARLSDLARELWRALPVDGEQVTNVDIRSRDEFAEVDGRDLQQARKELKAAALVELRSGRDGGGLRRVVESAKDERAAEEPGVPPPGERTTGRVERELYEPFREWLIGELDEDAFVFSEALVTATARRQGKWTQPDVCQLTATNFENLPAATSNSRPTS